MTLRDFKKLLDLMTDKELNQVLVYNSESLSISGMVDSICRAKENLYNKGEDDPAPLYTKASLLQDGYDEEDIDGMDVEIPRGQWYINF